MNVCRFCDITLHARTDGKGWEENIEPNCPKNPSGSQYGHSTVKSSDIKEKI